MGRSIIDLMHACVVKLTTPLKEGSGFFVAPDLILTCAHVVEGDTFERCYQGDITVRWKNNFDFAVAKVKTGKYLTGPVDIALLEYTSRLPETPPCVLLDDGCQESDELVTFGYPHELKNAEPDTFKFSGYTGDTPPFMKFKAGRVKPGMSGAPLLNMRTKRVCGMVKFSDDAASAYAGGGAIPSATILAHFGELKDLQDQYHRQGSEWHAVVGIRVPGDLLSRVQTEIDKILSKPRLNVLRKCVSNTLKAEHHEIAESPAEIAAKLIDMETELVLIWLLVVRKDVAHQLQEEGKADQEIDYVRSAVLDIVGWRVLLSVNKVWMAQNLNKLYPAEFPDAIAMPVQTDTGIEIVHAAIKERCARFNSIEGKLMGVERMPAVEHEFLEEGFDIEDIVRDIKTAIFKHINRKRGVKEQVPDNFTPEVDKHFNAKLRVFNTRDKNVYFVVKQSGKGSPINDQVYQRLKSDLSYLQVIFQESDQAENTIVVNEIELDSTLECFFDKEA
jgi:hypothetical protein